MKRIPRNLNPCALCSAGPITPGRKIPQSGLSDFSGAAAAKKGRPHRNRSRMKALPGLKSRMTSHPRSTLSDPKRQPFSEVRASKVIRVARWHATFFTILSACVSKYLRQKSCVPPDNAQLARNFWQHDSSLQDPQERNCKKRKRRVFRDSLASASGW